MAYESMKNIMFRQTITQVSTEQKEALGTLRILDDGRKFRYCENGAGALIPGQVVMGPAVIGNHTGIAVVANVAVGAKSIQVTLGATEVTENQYAGGFLQILNATAPADEGYQYKIATHPAAALSTAVTLYLDEPVVRAIPSAGTTVSLVPNRFKNVIETTGVTVVPSGIAVCNVPASTATVRQYFWAQSGGEGIAKGNATATTVGRMIAPGAAGTVELATALTNTVIGIARASTVDGQATGVLLFLD